MSGPVAGPRQRGMSLVELLVAMALAALLMLLLNSVLSGVKDGWLRARAAARGNDQQLVALQLLRGALAGALPPDPHDARTRLQGGAQQLEWLAAPPQALAASGPLRLRLELQEQADGAKALMLSAAADAPRAAPAPLRLVTGLASASFAYAAEADDSAPAPSWTAPAVLPRLIWITLVFMDKNVPPLRLAIAPRRSLAARCQLDLISLNCRM
ncbi:MAG: prepilin-type N-terminal cleavage/methylation domain-containing protein [Pseudomonadota bacterium]